MLDGSSFPELNMHFVNSHFMHPDDLLDEDRGAALGWEKLKKRLDQYMTWLNESAEEACVTSPVQSWQVLSSVMER